VRPPLPLGRSSGPNPCTIAPEVKPSSPDPQAPAHPTWLRVLVALLSLGILAVDVSLPLGIAGGVPYVAVVLMAIASRSRREVFAWAVFCSALTVLGAVISPQKPDTDWFEVLGNRALALFAIWVTAGVGAGLQRAREELAEREERLRLALDATSEGIWDWDLRTDRMVFSDHWLETFVSAGDGRAPGVETWRKVVHPDDRPAARDTLEAHLRGETEVYEVESRLRTGAGSGGDTQSESGGGEWRWYLRRGHVVARDEAGAPLRMVGSDRDVSERRRAAEALESSRRRLAGIIDSAMDAIVTVDGGQRIVLFNAAAERIFGRRAVDVIGEPLGLLIPERLRGAHGEHVERFASSGATSRRMSDLGEVLGVRSTGEEFPAEASISQVDTDGERLLTVILRDLTERRRAEEERREAEQRARTAEELAAVGTLTAGIAHDVGTPMNVILGYAEMLERSLENPRNKSRAGIIVEQVKRVSVLIQTLLNLARPKDAKPVPVDLAVTLERSIAFFQEKLRNHGIEVERRFAGVPAVQGDPDRLQQVFLNLFVNAADAMRNGGTLRVELEVAADGWVAVRVRDTGVGIPPDAIDRIFEAFYTTKERGKGTGLGLLVARGIVLDHGGSIEVSSEVGKGTEFLVRLPAGLALATGPAAGAEPRDKAPQG